MFPRRPQNKSTFYGIIKGLIYFEVGLFFGSFFLYRKLCRDQDFRYFCHRHCSPILDAFYSFLDLVGHGYYREVDYKKWGIDLPKQQQTENK